MSALPAQLRDLRTKAADQPEPVRDALLACLAAAPPEATADQVLADTFARLGYLPREAEQAAAKLLPTD